MSKSVHEGFNDGYIHGVAPANVWQFGGATLLKHEDRLTSGDWRQFVTDEERQSFRFFDTSGCVTFSDLNVNEITFNFLHFSNLLPVGHLEKLTQAGFINAKGNLNASDRDVVRGSGTTEEGNAFWKVVEYVRTKGLVPEADWPASETFQWADYYRNPTIAEEAVLSPKRDLWKSLFKVEYEMVSTDDASLRKALRHSPIQIATACCPVWNQPPVNVCMDDPIHATTLLHIADDGTKYIFDQYPPFVKTLKPGYKIWAAMKIVLSPIKPGEVYPFRYTFNRTKISKGERSVDVQALQRLLVGDGCLRDGSYISGFYDAPTVAAVFAFQKKYVVASWWDILWVKGEWAGPATIAKLNQLYGVNNNQISSAQAGAIASLSDQSNGTNTTVDQVKSGYKTTEFWLTLVQSVGSLLVIAGVFTPDQASALAQAVTSIVGGFVVVVSLVSYIKARKEVKLGALRLGQR